MDYKVVKDLENEFERYLVFKGQKLLKLNEFDKVYFCKNKVLVKQYEAYYNGKSYNNLIICDNKGNIKKYDCEPKYFSFKIFQKDGIVDVYKEIGNEQLIRLWSEDVATDEQDVLTK